jgi:hypothetical protein
MNNILESYVAECAHLKVENMKMAERIAELKKERDALHITLQELAIDVVDRGCGHVGAGLSEFASNLVKFGAWKEIQARNLEQQAKGIDFVNNYRGNRMDFSQAERRIVDLRTQAKQLREGVE